MTITLHPDQEAWLHARVARGEFVSVEAGARQLLGERIAEREHDGASEETAWMKPYIEAGLAALDRGDAVSLEQHKAQNAVLLASLKT